MFEKLSTWWGGSSPEIKPTTDTKPVNSVNPLNPKGLKPCCVCTDFRGARDECYMQFDSEVASEKCKDQVAAYVKCMRGYGFEI